MERGGSRRSPITVLVRFGSTVVILMVSAFALNIPGFNTAAFLVAILLRSQGKRPGDEANTEPAMIGEFLIRWGPPTILALSLAVQFGRSRRLRRELREPVDALGMTDRALGLVREFHRRAFGVVLVYFLFRCLFPEKEHDFGSIHWLADDVVRLSGLAIAAVGALWILATRVALREHWSLDMPATALPWLVNTAPFRVSRNPVLLGVLVEIIGLFLTSPTALTLMALTAIWLSVQLQVRLEEENLRACYGPDYLAYCQQVRRWL